MNEIDCNFKRRVMLSQRILCMLKENNGFNQCDKENCIFQKILNLGNNYNDTSSYEVWKGIFKEQEQNNIMEDTHEGN